MAGNSHSGVRAAKNLGQHFLNNPRVIERIVTAVAPEEGEITSVPVFEIGPGTGALTRPLLAAGAAVTVFEMDDRCWPVLEAMGHEFPGKLTVVRGDALVELPKAVTALKGTPYILTGNLPYNVGTEMVVQALTLAAKPVRMVFMLQKEVVQRIVAGPHTPGQWGRLGVLCSLHAGCRKLFDVPPGAFTPPPKVMSSIVQLLPLPKPRYEVTPDKLDTLLRLTFGQRRKMLRATLKGIFTEETFAKLNIPATARPEELTLEQLCTLARALP